MRLHLTSLQLAIGAASLVALVSCTSSDRPPLEQAQPPLPRPEIKVGDTWTYRQVDSINKTSALAVLSVLNVSERAIQTVTKMQESAQELDGIWTPEWNAVATGEGEIYQPDSGWLRFPLPTSGSYEVAYELRRPRTDRIQLAESHTGRARVIGWEYIRVPAGNFRALKVEVDETFFILGWSARGGLSAKTVIWYSPDVKRWVKSTYEDFGAGTLIGTGGMRLNAWTLELINYSVR
jgi:hypothetical protein